MACSLIGLAVLSNYWLRDAELWRPTAVGKIAHPWTAVCFVALGAGAWGARPRKPRITCFAACTLVAGILAFRLVTLASGSDAFDRLSLFRERLAEEMIAGQDISMSPQTIAMLLFIVVALAMLRLHRIHAAQIAATFGGLFALTAHLGMLSGVPAFYGQMALPTMFAGLLAALAVLTQTAHRAPLRHILRRRGVGRRARHQIVILTGPLILIGLLMVWTDPETVARSLPVLATLLVGITAAVVVHDVRIKVRNGHLRIGKGAKALSPLLGDLRGAAERGEMFLLYQPQLDMTAQRLAGMEALVRWSHPTEGLVGPTDFIPLAEKTGVIIPLGRWILRSACEEAVRWQSSVHTADIKISVNVSPVQVRHPAFAAMVKGILHETGLPPGRLILEITENVMVAQDDPSIEALRELSLAGIGIAIDDFGTGYSSLSYLQRLPHDFLKIDRTFVSMLPHDKGAAAIARAIVAMGHSLGKRIIAEGVETAPQAAFLRDLGCDEAQGYLYAPPLGVAALQAYAESVPADATRCAAASVH